MRYMNGMGKSAGVSTRDPGGLSFDALRAVPSIFATEAHESRSERFAVIPTADVVKGMMAEGFLPFFAQQGRSRVAGKEDFTKHMIRFRHASRKTDGGEAHEVILLNANDGTSRYVLINGVFRFVCLNGLMTGDIFGECRVSHVGDAVSKVIEGSYQVLDDGQRVLESVDNMKSIELSRDESRVFATAAHQLRFNPECAPIEPERLLDQRRFEDRGSDVWTTFNRLQENLIRGGQSGRVRGSNGRTRRATVRQINGIDQSTKLNQALWTLAEGMAALKSSN